MNVLSIKASDIENWTNREPRRAQELLPKLLWKLILASSNNIEDHHFPFENAVQYNGYDGFIKTTDNNPFYPDGISAWEFGTDEDIKGKFNKDYNKRSENPNNVDPKQTTFCFVTSRIWNHREGIAEFTMKKQKEGIWKNVRIIDANNLEMWLAQCPSVSVWFSKIIGRNAYDLIDLATYWDSIVSKTKPELTAEFFRIGREKPITEEIIKLIEKNEKLIILSTESKIEGILTIAAELLENQDIKYKQLLSKIIVALSSEALNNAYQNFNDSIIIPAFKNEKDQINIQGTIIIPTEKNGPIDLLYKNSARCHLSSRRRRDFSASLESIGFNADKADKLTSDVKCRFSPLVKIAEKKFNYKMMNSPIDSLHAFFCLWHPQGVLSLGDRIELLGKIIEEYYFTGRNLINTLFPSGSGIVGNLLEFKWRYIEKKKIEVTTKDYYDSIEIIAEHFIKTLNACYDDWKLIIKYFPIFDKAFDTLKVDKNDLVLSIPYDDQLKLCKYLVCEISRHKKFANEDWSLPEKTLKKLEQLYDLLLTESPLKYVAFYSHDFYGMNPCVFDEENYDYEKEKNELQKERVETLEKIIDKFGLNSLYQIVPHVSDIDLLVSSLVNSKYVDNITIDFIKTAHNQIPRFVEMLVNSMYYTKGITFFCPLLENESEDIQFITNQLPVKPDVIELIEKMSPEQQNAYWENVYVWMFHEEKGFVQDCLIKLLQVNRPYTVMRQLCFDDFGNSEIILEALYKGLLCYPNSENNGICLDNISSHELQKLFEKLYDDKNADTLLTSQLEFAYVQKFDLNFEPKCLIENLLSDPSLFLEIISYCFKNDENDDVMRKINKAIRSKAFEVLARIKRLPGQQGKEIDKEKFNDWITKVRKLAKERKYEKACDIEIGKILSYSPIDEDGVWPHKYVREFFELNSSEILENEFRVGLYNQRGVHIVTGGDEEEKIAKKYYGYAEKLRISYPRTSYILNTIGDSFKSESRCERARELKGYY